MARRSNRSIDQMFGGAQTSRLETQIAERDDEIEALKQQIESLKQADGTAEGVQTYPIDAFTPLRLPNNLTQPRKYFDPQAMERLKQSIAKVGIQEPLLVRQAADGKLEIVSGERRWRNCLELQLPELPAIAKELSDEAALEIALVANLMREDLNPVEETDSIVALISLRLNLNREQLPSILFKVKNLRSRYRLNNHEVAQAIQQAPENSGILSGQSITDIDAILSEFGMVLESFVSNRLAALQKMPHLLLEAVRQGSIAFSKADVIRKGKLSPAAQQALLQQAVEQELTKQQIRQHVRVLQARETETHQGLDASAADLREQVQAKVRRLRSAWRTVERHPELKQQVEEIDTALQAVLSRLESLGSI